MTVRRMTTIGLMVCVTAVCSWITIPFVVPFTLQTFAVFCCLLLLGGLDGTIAVFTYIVLGCIGLPVFSGFQGGFGHILGPTGGYILGFLCMTLCFWVFEQITTGYPKRQSAALCLGLLLCYIAGTLWFYRFYAAHGNAASLMSILTLCVLPYVITDLLKLLLAVLLCNRVVHSGILHK